MVTHYIPKRKRFHVLICWSSFLRPKIGLLLMMKMFLLKIYAVIQGHHYKCARRCPSFNKSFCKGQFNTKHVSSNRRESVRADTLLLNLTRTGLKLCLNDIYESDTVWCFMRLLAHSYGLCRCSCLFTPLHSFFIDLLFPILSNSFEINHHNTSQGTQTIQWPKKLSWTRPVSNTVYRRR